MGVMKFVLSDELEQELRKHFRKKGDLSKIAEAALRAYLKPKDTIVSPEE